MAAKKKEKLLEEIIENENKHMDNLREEHSRNKNLTEYLDRQRPGVEASYDAVNAQLQAASRDHQHQISAMEENEKLKFQMGNDRHYQEVKIRRELNNKEIEQHRNAESLAEQKTIEHQTKEKERTAELSKKQLAEGTEAVKMAREQTTLAQQIGDEKSKERREFLNNLEKEQLNDLTEMKQVFIENANREKDNAIAHANELQALKLYDKKAETELKSEQVRMEGTRSAYEIYLDADGLLNEVSDNFSKANAPVNMAVRMRNPMHLRRSLGAVTRSLESMRTNKTLLTTIISRLAECKIDEHQEMRKVLITKMRESLNELDNCTSSAFDTTIDAEFLSSILPVMEDAKKAIQKARDTWANLPPIDRSSTVTKMLMTNTEEMMRRSQLAVENDI